MRQALVRGAERFLEWVLPFVLLAGLFSFVIIDYLNTRSKTYLMWNYLNAKAEQAKPAASPEPAK